MIDLVSRATVYLGVCERQYAFRSLCLVMVPARSFLPFHSTRHGAFRKPLTQKRGSRVENLPLARACRTTFWLVSRTRESCGSDPT